MEVLPKTHKDLRRSVNKVRTALGCNLDIGPRWLIGVGEKCVASSSNHNRRGCTRRPNLKSFLVIGCSYIMRSQLRSQSTEVISTR